MEPEKIERKQVMMIKFKYLWCSCAWDHYGFYFVSEKLRPSPQSLEGAEWGFEPRLTGTSGSALNF